MTTVQELKNTRDALLAKLEANEDWQTLKSMGALSEDLEYDPQFEQEEVAIETAGDRKGVEIHLNGWSSMKRKNSLNRFERQRGTDHPVGQMEDGDTKTDEEIFAWAWVHNDWLEKTKLQMEVGFLDNILGRL